MSESDWEGKISGVKIPEHSPVITGLERQLIHAAYIEDHDKVKDLLSQGADVSASENAAMFRAVQNRNMPILETLLEAGADATAKESQALVLATWNGGLDFVRRLHEAGADPRAQDSKALFYAASLGSREIVDYLYDKSDVDVALLDLATQQEEDPADIDQDTYAYLKDRRQSELDANALQSSTNKIADTWSPSQAEGASLHDRLNPSQGDTIERPVQRARMRL